MARAHELTPSRPAARAGLPLGCLAGALLMHLALLVSGAQALEDWQREHLRVQPAAMPSALKVRAVSAPSAPAPPAEASPPVLSSAAGATAVTPLQPAAVVAPPADLAPSLEPIVYVPRALLTVGPVARAPVLLDWPANWLTRGTYRGVLKLYLDEQGRVERVEADPEAPLPDPLFEAARSAFLAASFSPGELHGQAVRTWVRVEVEFDAESPAKLP